MRGRGRIEREDLRLLAPLRERVSRVVELHGPLSGVAVARQVGASDDMTRQTLRALLSEGLVIKSGRKGSTLWKSNVDATRDNVEASIGSPPLPLFR